MRISPDPTTALMLAIRWLAIARAPLEKRATTPALVQQFAPVCFSKADISASNLVGMIAGNRCAGLYMMATVAVLLALILMIVLVWLPKHRTREKRSNTIVSFFLSKQVGAT